MGIEASIVIRTLNEERHLPNLLEGIKQQTFQDYEIVHVDSGSTDRTVEIVHQYTSNIFHIPQREFTFGRSLNLGCQHANGRYLVFVSAHVRPVDEHWLSNLIKPFEEPKIGMVYGRQLGVETTRIAEERDFLQNYGPTSKILLDEPLSNNANSAIPKELWLQQPFDETLTGVEDVDWARKIQSKGYRVYYPANAAVYHIHEESLRQIYRRFKREGIANKQIFPDARFTKSQVIRGLLLNVPLDISFGIRHRKGFRKLMEVPATRLAEFLGTYQGINHKNGPR
jgi:glycosyltransferase involved in cell wall biosynthesis